MSVDILKEGGSAFLIASICWLTSSLSLSCRSWHSSRHLVQWRACRWWWACVTGRPTSPDTLACCSGGLCTRCGYCYFANTHGNYPSCRSHLSSVVKGLIVTWFVYFCIALLNYKHVLPIQLGHHNPILKIGFALVKGVVLATVATPPSWQAKLMLFNGT